MKLGTPMKWLSLLALCSVAACATSTSGQAAEAPTSKPGFTPQGEFTSTRGYSASFDETRVVGPRVEVSQRDDGTWAGVLLGNPVTVTLEGQRLVGPNFEFTWTQTENGLDGRGVVRGQLVRVTVDEENLYIRNGAQNWSLQKTSEGVYQDTRSTITLKGRALELPMPQTMFALLSFQEPGH